jgi:hypothetical protein
VSTKFSPTEQFANSVRLGGAMSVSGAAVSPNMGYHSSPAVTALLTVFNMRLGAWFANPSPTWLQSLGYKNNPPVWYFISELLGLTDATSSYVYVSDGGHFENMGVYELVRRRCRYIVAIDSGADPAFLRENLGHLVRKVRIDLGIRIEIDTDDTRPIDGFCKTHVAVGRIHYGDVHRDQPSADDEVAEVPKGPDYHYDAEQGVLVYLKVGLTGDEPADLLNYQAENPRFPYDPTLDQFYGETQFESYRALGLHTALTLFEAVPSLGPYHKWPNSHSTRQIFEAIYRAWMRDPPGVEHYLACNATYAELQEKLRCDARLRFFAVELCGSEEQRAKASQQPRTPDEALAERLMLVQMMTLLETAYLSLRLDRHVGHPYHAGWREVLKSWRNTSVFKGHWPHVNREFSTTFRDFLDRLL